MKKICLLLIAAFISFFLLQPKGQTGNRDDQYFQLYEKAEAYFNGSADEYTDSVALSYYLQFAQHVNPSHENALWLYNCHERMGILMQGLGYTSQESLQEFYTSLQFWKQYQLPDSVLFRLLLSAGNAHYAEGLLDSSAYYFSRAEKIILHYPNAGLAGDLYNSQGALYNELGDFKQSGNYFSKALEITKQTRPELKEAIFAMSANIASAFRLSVEFDAAIRAYSQLLQPCAVKPTV